MMKKMFVGYLLCFFCIVTDSSAVEKPHIQPGEVNANGDKQKAVLENNLINNPKFIKYYEMLRDRIKKNAYMEYAEYHGEGEVFVSFIVTRAGRIINKVIDENKTTAGKQLSDIALKAIAQAVPLPSFPKEFIDYPQLTFNIVISFENESDLKDHAPDTSSSLTPKEKDHTAGISSSLAPKKCEVDGTEMERVPIAYGIPSFDEIRAARKGELIRGGLIRISTSPGYGYICPKCKKKLIK